MGSTLALFLGKLNYMEQVQVFCNKAVQYPIKCTHNSMAGLPNITGDGMIRRPFKYSAM